MTGKRGLCTIDIEIKIQERKGGKRITKYSSGKSVTFPSNTQTRQCISTLFYAYEN